ncbi:MAG: hypothetical protein JWQ71_3461 [Pedosphaera sp.]|nr:hypothetical protein [Pedosphaera sp.]
MSTVKLSLAAMPLTVKIQFARQIALQMDVHGATFPDAPIGFDGLDDLANNLENQFNAAQVAHDVAKTQTAMQNTAETAIDTALTQIANYVQSVSDGDASIIKLIGMEVKQPSSSIGPLTAPTHFSAEASDVEGQVLLRWKTVRGAKSYVAAYTMNVNEPAAWTSSATSTKGKCTVKGLVSGQKYWFRVAAFGAAGQGPWSDPVAKASG